MGCGIYWNQIRELEKAMGTMRRFGILESNPAFRQLFAARGKLMAQVGFKFPRTIIQLVKLVGMSPGSITLWEDIESGWMAEGRVKPGAPPVYHYITDEQAVAIINRDVSPELHDYLMTEDPYLGE